MRAQRACVCKECDRRAVVSAHTPEAGRLQHPQRTPVSTGASLTAGYAPSVSAVKGVIKAIA